MQIERIEAHLYSFATTKFVFPSEWVEFESDLKKSFLPFNFEGLVANVGQYVVVVLLPAVLEQQLTYLRTTMERRQQQQQQQPVFESKHGWQGCAHAYARTYVTGRRRECGVSIHVQAYVRTYM